MTSRSVTGADKEAFWAGHKACLERWRQAKSFELASYQPIPGCETAYRAGWQHASANIEGKAERKRGRPRGLVLIGLGLVSSAIGGVVMLVSLKATFGRFMLFPDMLIGAGILNVVLGIFAIITGTSDE